MIRSTEWQKEAICSRRPANWWDIGDPGNAKAKDLCGLCPVRRTCLTQALTDRVRDVIQGGREHYGTTKAPQSRPCCGTNCDRQIRSSRQIAYCSSGCRINSVLN